MRPRGRLYAGRANFTIREEPAQIARPAAASARGAEPLTGSACRRRYPKWPLRVGLTRSTHDRRTAGIHYPAVNRRFRYGSAGRIQSGVDRRAQNPNGKPSLCGISGAETLSEPAVNRGQKAVGIGPVALFAPQPGKGSSGAAQCGSSSDSPLEDDGFELTVPPRRERLWAATPGKHCRFGPEPVSGSAFRAAVSDWQRPEEPFAGAEPMVRIRFPPEVSLSQQGPAVTVGLSHGCGAGLSLVRDVRTTRAGCDETGRRGLGRGMCISQRS